MKHVLERNYQVQIRDKFAILAIAVAAGRPHLLLLVSRILNHQALGQFFQQKRSEEQTQTVKLAVITTLMKKFLKRKSESTHVYRTPSVGVTTMAPRRRMLGHSCAVYLIKKLG